MWIESDIRLLTRGRKGGVDYLNMIMLKLRDLRRFYLFFPSSWKTLVSITIHTSMCALNGILELIRSIHEWFGIVEGLHVAFL